MYYVTARAAKYVLTILEDNQKITTKERKDFEVKLHLLKAGVYNWEELKHNYLTDMEKGDFVIGEIEKHCKVPDKIQTENAVQLDLFSLDTET